MYSKQNCWQLDLFDQVRKFVFESFIKFTASVCKWTTEQLFFMTQMEVSYQASLDCLVSRAMFPHVSFATLPMARRLELPEHSCVVIQSASHGFSDIQFVWGQS